MELAREKVCVGEVYLETLHAVSTFLKLLSRIENSCFQEKIVVFLQKKGEYDGIRDFSRTFLAQSRSSNRMIVNLIMYDFPLLWST